MAQSHSRQLLGWTLPAAIAVLFGYLWYKKKKTGVQSDPGAGDIPQAVVEKTASIEIAKVDEVPSPSKTFSRSLSGVDSQPIDIKLPKELKATKSNTLVISDEDLDQEIEKIKSMKYGRSVSLMKADLREENITTITPQSVTPENLTMAKNSEEEQTSPQKQVVTETVQQEKVVPETLAHSHMSDFQVPENMIETQRTTDQLFADLRKNNTGKSMDGEIVEPVASSNCDTSNHGSISDNEVDSGRGETDHEERNGSTPNIGSPSPASETMTSNARRIIRFYFHIPNDLVGKLIGKKGSHVNNIRQKTSCKVSAGIADPRNAAMTLCLLEGYNDDVQKALRMIRKTFPQRQYKGVTLEEVMPLPPSLSKEYMSMRLMPSINNYTSIAYVVDPYTMFLYDSLNPEFQRCHGMTINLNEFYNKYNSPLLEEVHPNTLCVALVNNYWSRAMVLETYDDNQTAYLQLVDRGGYELVPYSDMRQMGAQFIQYRFLAIQVALDQVRPKGTDYWPQETADFIYSRLKGKTLYTHVYSHLMIPDEVPTVRIFFQDSSNKSYSLGTELVAAGLAEFTQYIAVAPQPAVQPVLHEFVQETSGEYAGASLTEEKHQAAADAH